MSVGFCRNGCPPPDNPRISLRTDPPWAAPHGRPSRSHRMPLHAPNIKRLFGHMSLIRLISPATSSATTSPHHPTAPPDSTAAPPPPHPHGLPHPHPFATASSSHRLHPTASSPPSPTAFSHNRCHDRRPPTRRETPTNQFPVILSQGHWARLKRPYQRKRPPVVHSDHAVGGARWLGGRLSRRRRRSRRRFGGRRRPGDVGVADTGRSDVGSVDSR